MFFTLGAWLWRAGGSQGVEMVMLNAAKTMLLLGGLACCMAARAEGRVVRPVDGYGISDPGPTLNLDSNAALRRDLEKSGVLSRTGPFRVALPIASFGDNGPKLMFTYVPRMKDDAGSKVFMLFMRINLD
jgi:hypothetical protein